MLHQSLLDLAEQAPRCREAAIARGVLTESHEILRNAVAHREPVVELTHWYSTLVSDVLHSPAVGELTGPAVSQVVLTGAIGRGDGLPTSRIEWLTVTSSPEVDTSDGEAANAAVAELLTSVDLIPAPHQGQLAATDRSEWQTRIRDTANAGDARAIGVFDDAGTWLRESLLDYLGSALPVLREAVDHRPPALRAEHGLPDREATVDIHRDLLTPISDIARWAGLTSRTKTLSSPERITAARAAGILHDDEAELLELGWTTGLELQFRRWLDHVVGNEVTAEDLTALQRSSYGAASRGIAGAIRSLAARHQIDLPTQTS